MKNTLITNYNHGLRRNNGQTQGRLSFYKSISLKYGCQTANLLKRWSTFRYDLSQSNARLLFLNKCRREEVTPSHITNSYTRMFKFNSNTCHRPYSSMINLQSKKLLKLEINDLYVHINFVRKRLNALVFILNSLKIDNNSLINFRNLIEIKSQNIFLKLE